VADDSVERLCDLLRLPSLEQAFAELVVQEDTGRMAEELVGAMRM
jgi:hypothetical protein